jgi:hypothetical protein
MSLTLATDSLPEPALAELTRAVAQLEQVSLAARLSNMLGQPIEALRNRLPNGTQGLLDGAVRTALATAMQAALRTAPTRNPLPIPARWFHRGLAAASGAAGGAFGLPGTLVELPVSTTLLLRQIAAIAAEQGEDLAEPTAAAECLKVFALGGRSPGDDAAETGYFAVRIALTEALKGAVGTGMLASVMPGFLSAVASRFVGPVSTKLAAQAAPVIGAAAGATVNLAFLEHFRGVAEGHFTVRRLERRHGAAPVQAAYQALAATRDAKFLG